MAKHQPRPARKKVSPDGTVDKQKRELRLRHHWPAAVAELQKRCDAASIEVTREPPFSDENENDVVFVAIPNGRDVRRHALFSASDIADFLSIDFERYVALGSYYAVCDRQGGRIEALITRVSSSSPFGAGLVLPRLLSKHGITEEEYEHTQLTLTAGGASPCVATLGPPSDELKCLVGSAGRRRFSAALTIDHIEYSTHECALDTLEKIAHSLFFQIDLAYDMPPLGLALHRRIGRRSKSRRSDVDSVITFPQYEYDKAPMELYWYARSAEGLPLLRFLALYQSIEYYFPHAMMSEAKHRIRQALKHPGFSIERDADILSIAQAAKLDRAGAASERAQLKATLRECVDETAVLEYILENESRKKAMGAPIRGLTKCRLVIKEYNGTVTAPNLVEELAERIYDIRCRVVHTKESGNSETELLLPGSKAVDSMQHDIDTLEFIASKVLISASAPLRL